MMKIVYNRFIPFGRFTALTVLVWLFVNLCTAFIAANVVGQFEGTIDKLVALAVLMPMVAGLGGNAGTQVLALMVRGLALGQVGASNARTLLWKEVRVAALNGLLLIGWSASYAYIAMERFWNGASRSSD